LPSSSFFNVIRFGTRFENLFDSSSPYTEANVNRALTLAANMKADLGGTDIYEPLLHILGQGRSGVGLRQLFVLTDGEVGDTDRVIQLASSHRSKSRIFTIGIGGADAGLVEGLANATGGRSDFVVSGEDLSSKVIAQLQTSLSSSLTEVAVHVAGDSSIDISPFPILPIAQSVSSTIFLRLSEPIEGGTGVLLCGDFCGDRQNFVIESRPARIDATLLYSLYAYEALRCLEREVSRPDVFARCVSLSVSSGVLCNETAFIGVCQQAAPHRISRSNLRLLGLGQVSYDSPPDDLLCVADECFAFGSPPQPSPGADLFASPRVAAVDPFAPSPGLGAPAKKSSPSLFDEPFGPSPEAPAQAKKSFGGLFGPSPDSRAQAQTAYFDPFGPSPDSPAPAKKSSPRLFDDPPDSAATVKLDAPGRFGASPASRDDVLMTVVGMQHFDGCWQDVAKVLEVAGKRIEMFDELRGIDANLAEMAFATIIAIALLRKQCARQQNSWVMIERKGLDWLARTGIAVTELVDRAFLLL
jgi:hypothetical protein